MASPAANTDKETKVASTESGSAMKRSPPYLDLPRLLVEALQKERLYVVPVAGAKRTFSKISSDKT